MNKAYIDDTQMWYSTIIEAYLGMTFEELCKGVQ